MQDESKRGEAVLKFINMWETFKLYSVIIGRYTDFCRAFSRVTIEEGLDKGKLTWKNPQLHDQFVSEIAGDVRDFCGEHLGTNPNLATHPIMKAIMERRTQ